MTAATKDFLAVLHADLAKALSEKIKSGEATAADMAVARQFLKDNGIDAIPTKGNHLSDLQEGVNNQLPDFPDPEEDAFIQ
jgi:hypothetical protein